MAMTRSSISMAMKRSILGRSWLACLSLCCLAAAALPAHGQSTTLLQIPNVSVVAGLASGGSVTAVCSTAYDAAGDGCPAAQSTLGSALSSVIDSNGNIYIADQTNKELRVIYKSGSALATAIIAANVAYKVTAVQSGSIYLLVGGGAYTEVTSAGGVGDTAALSAPVSVALDGDGNVFFGDGASRLRSFFVSNASGKFSTLLNGVYGNPSPAITPVVGLQYALIEPSSSGYAGDGKAPAVTANAAETNVQRGIAVDSSENLYIADSGNNAVRMISGATGLLSTYLGSTGCVEGTKASCTAGDAGNSGPITAAETNGPYALTFDANGNLYIGEEGSGEVRVIYNGSGTLPGITAPVKGYIYLIAGGGTSSTSGTTALSVQFTAKSGATTNYAAFGLGFDSAGNLYVADRVGHLWQVNATTRIATILGGSTLTSTGGQATTTAKTACSASNAGGSKTVDALGDGCLGTQAVLGSLGQNIPFDAQGNFYVIDTTYNVLHEFNVQTLFPQTATGSASAVQTLGFASLSAQTLGTVSLGVQGIASSDFVDAGASTCVANAVLAVGSQCLLNVEFSPLLPGTRNGFVGLSNASGTVVGEAYISGTAAGAESTVDPGTQTSVGSGISAAGVAVDPAGNIFVADQTSATLLEYAAGSSNATKLSPGLASPKQVAVDGVGNVLVADSGNNRISIYSKAAQTTSVLAGSFSKPQGVAVDGAGDVYVADTGNQRIIEVYPNGNSRTLVTSVSSPTRLSFDATGDLFILDSGNQRVVEIPNATGTQATVATPGFTPVDMALDAAGNLYVLDGVGLQVGVVAPAGVTYTLLSGLTTPSALAVDALGDVYVADSGVTSVAALNRQLDSIAFGTTAPGGSSAGVSFTLTDIGNVAVAFTNSSIAVASGNSADFTTAAGLSNGCSTTLSVAGQCTLTSTFAPVALGNFSATLAFPSNASGADATAVNLTGTGKVLLTTGIQLSLTSPASTSNLSYGTPLTVTAVFTYAASSFTPTGSITILLNGSKATTIPLVNGTSTYTYTFTPQAGSVAVTASYSGDANFASSNSTINLAISPAATTTTLTLASSLSGTTPSVTLTALVSSAVSGVQGTVTFYNGSTAVAMISLGSTGSAYSGTASYALTGLSLSNLTFTAVYNGTTNFATSTSAVSTLGGDFGLTPSLSLSTPQGGIALGSFVVTPYFGLAGSMQFSCSGLPANSNCRAYPQTLTFTGTGNTASTVQLQIFTNVSSSLAGMGVVSGVHGWWFWLSLLAGMMTMLLLLRAGGRARRILLPAMALLFFVSALSGCGNGTSSTNGSVTPTGTYNVTLTATTSSGVTHTSAITLVVAAKE